MKISTLFLWGKPMTEQQEKCKECRECCEYVEYPVTTLSMEFLELFVRRGEQMYINPENGVLFIRRKAPCIHLKKDGCDIYDKRPLMCQSYMCKQKDKSVREAKEAQCNETMLHLKEAIKQWRQSMIS